MGISFLARRLCNVTFRQLLIVSVFVAALVVFQCYWKTYSLLNVDRSIANNVVGFVSNSQQHEYAYEKKLGLDSDEGRNSRKGEIINSESFNFKVENDEDEIHSFTQKRLYDDHDSTQKVREPDNNRHNIQNKTNNMEFVSLGIPPKGIKRSSNGSLIQSVEMKPQNGKLQLLKTQLVGPTSLAQMNSLLLQSLNYSSMRPKWSSQPDRELLSTKLEIENARVVSNYEGLYTPVFRDVSKFSRSYELMEQKLKVYIYREGEKPIFHQPKMRGLYASEGWFMKLMEGNKRFIVKNPKKAHLFYMPFSSQILRVAIPDIKQMEQYLEKYVNLIAGRYHFWNRTEGADHFLAACHDWASRITRQPMKNCIRSLCNANVAKGFQIGKDTSLPVTYIHSAMNPLIRSARKPASERTILAFFAGNMHGYLRPLLLKHWENKHPDMKIFGPMVRDVEGKRIYMEYMNSSKYCICARGYEVHSPRIIEAIFSECVPVIISDSYVPPFFEVLNWEAFSVFVRERDIPRLRSILLSIPEEKYLALHLGVKKVQQHFLWHKVPVKYDLFHMILHSVWNNRLSQIRPR